jgi:hypothetical protein
MIVSNGWIKYIKPSIPEPTQEELINLTKDIKIKNLRYFDSSRDINICYIKTPLDTISYWADKTERSSLKSAIQDCIAMGREAYRLDLREVGVSVDIDCNKLL